MKRQPPNSLQKLVRGMIRDLIHQANDQKLDEPSKAQPKQTKAAKSCRKVRGVKAQRSRYISASTRVLVLNRDKYKCVFCGRTSQQIQLEVDHIKPFSKGGSNHPKNL